MIDLGHRHPRPLTHRTGFARGDLSSNAPDRARPARARPLHAHGTRRTSTTYAPQHPASAAAIAGRQPETVMVLATAGGLDIAARVHCAEHAARTLGRPVHTVLVDTGTDDPATRALVADDGRTRLSAPDVTWGTAVALGLQVAHERDVGAVVLLGPDEPADSPAEDASPLAAAVAQLDEQRAPDVVCCPQARPWWQDPLSLHVLRPLCMPVLGFAPTDPLGATLVLSSAAVAAVLHRRGSLDRVTGALPHGLDMLTAARQAGLTVAEAPVRQPRDGHPRLDEPPQIDRRSFAMALPVALRLGTLHAPASRSTLPPARIALTGAASHPPAPAMFRDVANRCSEEARAGRASITGWPEPLVTAWHQAGVPHPDLPAIADELWPNYLRWLARWYRAAAAIAPADPTRALDLCIAEAERVSSEFLDAIALGSAAPIRDGQR